MKYWLMKSEPGSSEGKYSIDDLARDKSTPWTGVRNYQARNYMRAMQPGELALFYHSNSDPSGAVGVMRIKAAAHADMKGFDPKSIYYEPKATKENPVWECVDVEFLEKFPSPVALAEIRANKKLAKMEVLRKGSRLSIQPATEAEFFEVCRMGGGKLVKKK